MESRSPLQFEAWEKAFNEHSDNGKGISIDNLESIIFSLGYNPNQEEIEDMKSEINERNTVDKNTFIYLLYKHSRYSNASKQLTRAFDFFDTDKKSTLTYGYVRHILKSVDHPFADEQIERIFEKSESPDEIPIDTLVKILLNQ